MSYIKLALFIWISLLLPFTLWSQHLESQKYCGFDEFVDWKIENEPDYREKHAQLIERFENYDVPSRGAINGILHIPVVFHIVTHPSNLTTSFTPEYEMYSDYHDVNSNNWNRIDAQLERLNTEYGNANIKFCLAQHAPPSYEGVPGTPGSWQQISDGTNPSFPSIGVTYHVSSGLSDFKPSDVSQVNAMDAIAPFNHPNEYKYLDIYVVDIVRDPNNVVVSGQSSFGISNGFDDIAVRANTVGDVSNSSNPTPTIYMATGTDQGKVAVHEVGHWMILMHTFANDQDCNAAWVGLDGDNVADTPPHTAIGTCPIGPPILDCNSLNTVYFNNHMDYACDANKVVVSGIPPLTSGQGTRAFNYTQDIREPWHSLLNRIRTGIEYGSCILSYTPQYFTAEFEISRLQICNGDVVRLTGMPNFHLPVGAQILSWTFTITENSNLIPPQTITVNGNFPVSSILSTGGSYVPGIYTIDLSLNYVDANQNVGTLSWTHPEQLTIEECDASPFRYIKKFDYQNKSLSDLSIVVAGRSPAGSGDGYIIAGTNLKGVNQSEIYIVKVNLLGEIVWEYTFQNSQTDHVRAFDIIDNENASDHYLITGYYVPQNGEMEVLVLEIQDMGATCALSTSSPNPVRIPVKTVDFDANELNNAVGVEIINTTDFGFAIAGAVGEGFTDFESKKQLLIKLDNQKQVQWIEEFDYSQIGDPSDYDFGNSVVEITGYNTPTNPSVFQAAYFLGGSKSKRIGAFRQGVSSLIIEDNGTQRDILSVTNNTWETPSPDFDWATDVLYEENENLVYQKAFTQLTHGMMISKINPSNGIVERYYESNLLNWGTEYLGLKMINSNSNQDLVLTGSFAYGGIPTAQKLSKSYWPVPPTIGSGNLNTINVRAYSAVTPLNTALAGAEFPLFPGANSLSQHFYFIPKHICQSPNGGYMFVHAGEPASGTNLSSLCLLKLDEDLNTGCSYATIMDPNNKFYPRVLNNPAIDQDNSESEVEITLQGAPDGPTPCSDFCLGDFTLSECDNDNDGTAIFDLDASLSALLGTGHTFSWFSDATLTTPIFGSNSYNGILGSQVYVEISTPDGCVGDAEVSLETSPPPVVNNYYFNGIGPYNLANIEPIVAGFGQSVVWYEDIGLTVVISNTTSYSGNSSNIVYAQVTNAEGCVAIANVYLDCDPLLAWPKQSYGNGSMDMVRAITNNLEGTIYVAGTYNDQLDFLGQTNSKSGTNLFVAQIDDCGTMWMALNTTGNVTYSSSAGWSLAEMQDMGIDLDDDGNVYVAGTFTGTFGLPGSSSITASGTSDGFIAKFDNTGSCVWLKNIAIGATLTGAVDVKVDRSDNSVYVTGTAVGSTSQYYYLRKLNSSGTVQWTISDATVNSIGATVELDGSGNPVIGVYCWNYSATSISVGGSTIALSGNSTSVFGKVNSSGSGIWVDKVEGPLVMDIGIDDNDNVYATGLTVNSFTFNSNTYTHSGGWADLILLKYSSSGVQLWARTAGSSNSGASQTQGDEISFDQYNNVLIAGSYATEITFNTLGTFIAGPQTTAEHFVIKYDDLGNEIWIKNKKLNYFPGHGRHDYPLCITSDLNGMYYIGSSFIDQVTFGSVTLNTGYGTLGPAKTFIARLVDYNTYASFQKGDARINVIDSLSNDILIYPNPTSGYLEVKSRENNLITHVHFLTIQGESAKTIDFDSFKKDHVSIDLQGLASGVYFLQISTSGGTFVEKVVLHK